MKKNGSGRRALEVTGQDHSHPRLRFHPHKKVHVGDLFIQFLSVPLHQATGQDEAAAGPLFPVPAKGIQECQAFFHRLTDETAAVQQDDIRPGRVGYEGEPFPEQGCGHDLRVYLVF